MSWTGVGGEASIGYRVNMANSGMKCDGKSLVSGSDQPGSIEKTSMRGAPNGRYNTKEKRSVVYNRILSISTISGAPLVQGGDVLDHEGRLLFFA